MPSKLPKLKLLVVDDAKFIRDLVHKTIRSDYPSFIVVEAENGKKAQQAMENGGADLILCDWEMPEMTGIEFLQWVRGEEDHAATPFIMVTSLDKRVHVVEALTAGVNDYVSKPFTAEQLTTKVMRQLVKAGKLTEAQSQAANRIANPMTAGGAELLASSFSSAKVSSAKKVNRIKKGLLLLGEERLPAQILSINKTEAQLFINLTGSQPRLADPLLLGLALTKEETTHKATVKGFIKALQLKEANPASTKVSLTMHFAPMDSQAEASFNQLMELATS